MYILSISMTIAISSAGWLSLTIIASLSVSSVSECWDDRVMEEINKNAFALLWYNNIITLMSLNKHNASIIWWQEFRVGELSFSLLVLLEEAWLELNETNARQTRLWPTWDYEQFMPGTWGTFQHNNTTGEMNIA